MEWPKTFNELTGIKNPYNTFYCPTFDYDACMKLRHTYELFIDTSFEMKELYCVSIFMSMCPLKVIFYIHKFSVYYLSTRTAHIHPTIFIHLQHQR